MHGERNMISKSIITQRENEVLSEEVNISDFEEFDDISFKQRLGTGFFYDVIRTSEHINIGFDIGYLHY